MAGHSKWSKVKHIKGPLDQKRGALFSKLSKEIALAAKLGGGDPGANIRLRAAIQSARDKSMPSDNIERAIKRGTGADGGAAMEEIIYEGYGPGGVALLVEVATDNKNRTAQEMRLLFTRNHGNLGASGSVAYLFHRRGLVVVPKAAATEDRLMELTLDAGAEDLADAGDYFEITTPVDRFYAVAEALRAAGIAPEAQKLVYLPTTHTQVSDPAMAAQVLKLHDALSDNDDVQNVHANFEISEDVLAQIAA